MNKSDLVKKIEKNNKYLTKKDISESVSEIINYSSSSLEEGNRIEIRGFGSFSIRRRDSRIARNPKTGSSVKVESKYHAYFRAAKALRLSLEL